ncbi:hypothetical protein [Deinococcus sp.]|uniref:hypothetical protein n=1 Tax=Deinococcus sp. TaxID=47478 RepID=UPI0025D69B5F|nr:hypothetical protein [Deinococcus sp.]
MPRQLGDIEGFIKVVSDAQSGHLLGATLLCAGGAELIHRSIDLLNAHAPAAVIKNAVHIHPTLAEAVQGAVTKLG